MEEQLGRTAPRQGLEHAQVKALMSSLGSAEVLNLDTTIRQLMEPVASALKIEPGKPGSQVSLHIVCCNEYALVTG